MSSSAAASDRPLRRDPDAAVAGGVLAGLAERTGADLTLLRVGFVLATIVTGGLALLAYAIGWAVLPSAAPGPRSADPLAAGAGPPRQRFAGVQLGAGVGLLVLAALLSFRELGIWWSDALVWPLVLAAAGAALLWRQSRVAEPAVVEAPAPGGDATAPATVRRRGSLIALYRGVFGVLLVAGAALLFLVANDAVEAVGSTVLTALVVVLAVALVLAPFIWRLGRRLATERAGRIRSQERAELAAHLHDSVLQTLALVQKRAEDPREIRTLARRQERELRGWLAAGRSGPFSLPDARSGASFAAELTAAAEAIEDAHRVRIDLVTVGDCELGERASAVLGAAGEAMTNAAKFAPDGAISVYAEVADGRIEAFVRDRGSGFDPEAVPPDRHGVRESIVGRMRRAGGEASVRSDPGAGTEVGLSIAADGGGR